jgi:hypothetical protein
MFFFRKQQVLNLLSCAHPFCNEDVDVYLFSAEYPLLFDSKNAVRERIYY